MTEITDPSFGSDLRLALTAWRRFPWLPAVSVGLAAVGHLPEEPAFLPLLLVSLIVTMGWVGTERICYLRAFRGQPIHGSELLRFTRAFLIRYAVLGMVSAIPLIALIIGVLIADVLTESPSEQWVGGFLVALYVVFAFVDLALTFVTPALAFSTRRVRRALAIGLRMIRSEWPSSAWYVLVPPLAAVLIAQILTRTSDVAIGTQLLTSAFATLLNLWFKGATAAFYLRRHDVGNDGAAFIPKDAETSHQMASPAGGNSDESMGKSSKDLKTTYLGNYMEPTSSEIITALQDAGIEYWSKNEPVGLPLGEFGYRIFVDKDRLDEARSIADRIHTEAVRLQALEETELESPPEDTEH